MKLEAVAVPFEQKLMTITISGETISDIQVADPNTRTSSKHLMAFPGLINMHEHLAFNAFPPLKSEQSYANHLEWAKAIHLGHPNLISRVNSYALEVKVLLGEFKNLQAGVTTVSDHERKTMKGSVIDNYRAYNYLHAISTDKHWRLKMLLPPQYRPWFIHLNEGFGSGVELEINRLKKWNIWRQKIIGIHGISLNKWNIKYLDALVWCPASNYFLYNQTIALEHLHTMGEKVFLGSDSTLSSSPNFWEHIRQASDIVKSTPQVYRMLTENPASYFSELSDRGYLKAGFKADIVIANKKKSSFWDAFYEINPIDIEIVIKNGEIVLCSEEMKEKYALNNLKHIEGTSHYIHDKLHSTIHDNIKIAPHLKLL